MVSVKAATTACSKEAGAEAAECAINTKRRGRPNHAIMQTEGRLVKHAASFQAKLGVLAGAISPAARSLAPLACPSLPHAAFLTHQSTNSLSEMSLSLLASSISIPAFTSSAERSGA